MGQDGDRGARLIPRVLVLGGGGMLGHKLFQRLRLAFADTYCTLREDAGSTTARTHRPASAERASCTASTCCDLDPFHALLRRLRPDVIVNCVGVIKQRDAANAAIPSIRSTRCCPTSSPRLAEWGGRLIHFSTDCVFSGRGGGYREDDPSDADDLYGRSKYLGEVAHAERRHAPHVDHRPGADRTPVAARLVPCRKRARRCAATVA